MRLFITKGHFLKYLQILVKSSHKRIRTKNIIGIQSPKELLCKDRGVTLLAADRAATNTLNKGNSTEESPDETM